ncbi:MAG: hypothetical protein V1891_03925 [bacterium]
MKTNIIKFISSIAILLIFILTLFLSNANFILASNSSIKNDSSIFRLQNARLIKSSNNPAVYAIINGKKHKIPNADIFLNYGFNWQNIKIASNEEISSYPDLKIVKTENNPAVYYINEKKNIKKAHLSEKIFLDYGNRWEDIVIISEKDMALYKDAILVKTQKEPAVYVLEENSRKIINSAYEFESNGYKWEDIIEVSKLDLESYSLAMPSNNIYGANINQASDIAKSEISVSPTTGKKLNVSLSNYSPKDTFIATGSVGEFMEFNLESLQGDISISELTISSLGITANNDITYLSISDKNDEYFYYKTQIYNKKARFIFEDNLIINEGEIKTLIIKAAINKKEDIEYRTIGFGIDSADDIVSDGLTCGTFPIKGIIKEIRGGKNILGDVEITSKKLNFEKINPGAKNQKVAEFIVKETTGNEDVLIEKIAFYVRGNIKNTDIINFDLLDGNKKILSTVVWMQTDGKVEFDLTKNPLKSRKNTEEIISLQADIAGIGDKNFEFIIKDSSDIKIIGVYSQVELIAEIVNPINGFNNLTIKKGSIFAYLNEDSPDSLIAGDKTATLAIFDFKGMNTDIALKNFNLTINHIGTSLNENITIVNDSTGKEIYSIGADILNQKGTAEINIDPQKINLGGYLRLKIQAEIPENITPDTAYDVILDKFGFDDLQNELYIIKFQKISSGTITVKKSALYITPENIANSYTAGSKNVLLGQFLLQANYSEDIYIKHISIKSQEGYNEATAATGLYNFRLNLGNTAENEPLKIPIDFKFKYPYKITAGNSITLKIYADTYPTISENTVALTLSDINAYGKSSEAKPKIEGLNVNSSPVNFSQLDFSIIPNNNIETEITCGNNKKIGSFILKASGENIQVTELMLKTAGQSDIISYQNGYSNLKLKNGNRTLGTISKPFPEFNIFKTNFAITDNQETIVDVYADISECCDCDEKNLQVAMEVASSYGASSKVIIENTNAISNIIKIVCDCE